ncbi:jerky protein homolog-like [Nylanderia fulva]|uniref:jerky protein homolog-like n=1 Tax=Nylanderia fulva TaxID=613905 RepID=UPI0010FB80C2|nr:jerky protein homolog-like [Nylanderia fulva]XP_029162858.1 jerky protein homolog-like [Nylanderia fulva]XP_029162859.1 jerky protein homolog-like [Nylanderia fulva]XP_029162860.1 jerky protein homolog-like [Nylanderia fulva]XP_029162861.1 jerky protein homolog-like [Nylanderia fulva]
MEPMEFIAVESTPDHLDEFGTEVNCVPFDPFKVEEEKQELTDALKYCIDLLKDAQIIIDLQNSRKTISKRSQLMGKEIHRRIVDMLHSMKFENDEKVVKRNEEMLSCSEKESCSTIKIEQENSDIVLVEKNMSTLNQSFKSENEYHSMDYVYENSMKIENNENTNKEKLPTSHKRHINRIHPSIEDSIKILERLDRGEKIVNLAKEYNLSKWRIGLIKKSRRHFLEQKKLMREGKIYEKDFRFEQALYTWFLQKRSIGDSVTESMLKRQAIEFNELFKGTRTFKGINGFMNGFKTKHNIKCLTNQKEEILSADQELNNNFYQMFIRYCTDNKIPLDKIYNADETGLNWKMLPNKIVSSKDEHQSSEIESVENRVTLMVCTNATGSHKLPVLIIGKTNPHYLKSIKSLPVVYMNQENAWMDGQLMSRWYREVFLPEIERVHRSSNEKCLLLLDNASSHLSTERLNSINERCRVIFLPPSVSSLVQPMNQGIIEKLKKMYKIKLLKVMLTSRSAKTIPNLLELFDIYKCACLMSKAWGEVTKSDIKNGWRNIFPFCSNPKPEFDSQSLLHMVIKIPKYSNVTLEEINSWLHSDDNEQGWQILNDRQLAFPEEDDNNK